MRRSTVRIRETAPSPRQPNRPLAVTGCPPGVLGGSDGPRRIKLLARIEGPIVSAHPEPPHLPAERPDSVTWINRERTPAPGLPAPPAEPPSVIPAFIRNNPSRWAMAGGVLLLVLIALGVARHYMKPATPVGGAAASQPSLPLVTAAAPGTRSVTSTVTFTGTIHARYDMPISAEGE